MRGEIQKVHAGTRLDVNLEKGRVGDEREVLERKVKEADQRIDREVELLVGRLNVIKGEMTTTIVCKKEWTCLMGREEYSSSFFFIPILGGLIDPFFHSPSFVFPS